MDDTWLPDTVFPFTRLMAVIGFAQARLTGKPLLARYVHFPRMFNAFVQAQILNKVTLRTYDVLVTQN